MHYRRILGVCLMILACVSAPIRHASVSLNDTTLLPVISDNLPLVSSLTAYVYPNDSDAVSNTVNGATIFYDSPLYYPLDPDTTAWWNNGTVFYRLVSS